MNAATFDFSDSVVLVTGGSAGIGRAIAAAFLDAGATVAVTGRRADKLREEFAGDERAIVLAADAGDREQIRAAVDRLVGQTGKLDVVVSNAGGYAPGPLTDLGVDDWERLRATNVDGFFHLAQAVLPHLLASQGSLVAVSSVSGERGDWGQAAYNATKAAVSQFVRSLALDLGEQGVRVNAVAPAFTVTEITAAAAEDPAVVAAATNRVALGRLGQPTDIAPAVLFLASDAASYITGVVLPVDGGTMASTGQAH